MDRKQTDEPQWQFICPECGMGDFEIGALAGEADFYCEVCLSEDGRHVRLRRWLKVGEPAPSE